MKHLGNALLVSASLVAGAAYSGDAELIVFDWAGYEDPEFYVDFTEKHGDAPTFAFFSDEEEAFQKLRAGFKADAAHPCSQSVPKWMEAGLLAPIDPSRITEWDNLEPGFREFDSGDRRAEADSGQFDPPPGRRQAHRCALQRRLFPHLTHHLHRFARFLAV